MTKHTLSAKPRTVTGRHVKYMRENGITPANIFGKHIASVAIEINEKEFLKTRKTVGEATLVYVQIEGDKVEKPCLIREIDVHPVTGKLLHATLQQVDLKEKVSAPVPVVIQGEAPAEKDGLGILVQQLSEIEVSALPTDMPEGLIVDVSTLTEVDMAIYVKDLVVDATKLEIESDLDSIIVKIEPLAAEEKETEPAAAPAEGDVATATDAAATKTESEPEKSE